MCPLIMFHCGLRLYAFGVPASPWHTYMSDVVSVECASENCPIGMSSLLKKRPIIKSCTSATVVYTGSL